MSRSEGSLLGRQRVLFVSSNGVGMGHLTRLLAIARRLPTSIEASFVSMSQGLAVIEQFGFETEYVPCLQHTLSSADDWNGWLAQTLEHLLDSKPAVAVVFDGNVVYPGLASVVAERSLPLIWIRRGMWRSDQDTSESLASARHASFVVEPDDVASVLDAGASANRDGVILVDPIRLLESHEILTRDASCHALGFDTTSRYVLIQLGAGNNYNFIDVVESLIKSLKCERLTPVIAEWLTSEFTFDLWPDVLRLRAFPMSRYLRAFDFVVSAAGYNSYNELISFAVPSILVPNRNRAMDDQDARAKFAQQNGAAVHLDEELLPRLHEAVKDMLDPDRRMAMSESCRRIAKSNGAWRAAQLVRKVTEEVFHE